MPDVYLTVLETASLIGRTPRHVRHLVRIGQLRGEKRGRDLFVLAASAKNWQEPKRGRPFAEKSKRKRSS